MSGPKVDSRTSFSLLGVCHTSKKWEIIQPINVINVGDWRRYRGVSIYVGSIDVFWYVLGLASFANTDQSYRMCRERS